MSEGEKPRAEPEIIPPGRDHQRPGPRASQRGIFVNTHATHRIYVARLGPFGVLWLAVIFAIVSGVVLFVLLGTFLIVIALVGLLIAVGICANLFRRYFRPLR
jgi:hypothetical protein